jgi:hypothetical protein
MKNPFTYWHAVVLGAVDGFIFGGCCEIANRIQFEFRLRELERIAAEGGPIIDIAYVLRWWMLPCFFLLVFAVVSLFVHWLRSSRSLSITRLWQEVGFVAVAACVLPTLIYGWLNDLPFNSEIIGTSFFLFGLASVLNFMFGAFLQMVANYHARRRENLLP